MLPKYVLVAVSAALLAGCAYEYDQARSPEAGTAGITSNPAMNPPPARGVENTAAVGTTTLTRDEVSPASPPVVYQPPVVVAPAPTVYYDLYGRPYAVAPGTAPVTVVRP